MFKVMMDVWSSSRARGGPLAGALLWSAIVDDHGGGAGYHYAIDLFDRPDATPVAVGASAPPVPQFGRANAAGAAPQDGGGGAPAPQDGGGRRLAATAYADDTLDAFRRGAQREACAIAASSSWAPAALPQVVDVPAVRAAVAGASAAGIMKAA